MNNDKSKEVWVPYHGNIGARIETISGVVIKSEKSITTAVSSSGGGGVINNGTGYVSAPTITSEKKTTTDFWIRTQDGLDINKSVDHDISMLEGHDVSLIIAHGENEKQHLVGFVNRSASTKNIFISSDKIKMHLTNDLGFVDASGGLGCLLIIAWWAFMIAGGMNMLGPILPHWLQGAIIAGLDWLNSLSFWVALVLWPITAFLALFVPPMILLSLSAHAFNSKSLKANINVFSRKYEKAINEVASSLLNGGRA